MKRIIICIMCSVMLFICSCSSEPPIEEQYTADEIALAEKIYDFANNNYKNDGDVLIFLSLHQYDDLYLEFTYSKKPYYKHKESSGGITSLGFPTSFCYKVTSEGIEDKRYKGSLGSVVDSVETATWFFDGSKKDNIYPIYEISSYIIKKGK